MEGVIGEHNLQDIMPHIISDILYHIYSMKENLGLHIKVSYIWEWEWEGEGQGEWSVMYLVDVVTLSIILYSTKRISSYVKVMLRV